MLFSKTKVALQISTIASLVMLAACQGDGINSGNFSGGKENTNDTTNLRGSDNSVTYEMTFESTWSATTHPTNIPSDIRFSRLIGAAHNQNVTLWQSGDKASRGIELIAETGNIAELASEIDTAIITGKAKTRILTANTMPSPSGAGAFKTNFTTTSSFPLISVAAMLTPSPDWFTGATNINLLENGNFVATKVVYLYAYDAGTDSGLSYDSANIDTVPAANIYRLKNVNSNSSFDRTDIRYNAGPIGKLSFVKL